MQADESASAADETPESFPLRLVEGDVAGVGIDDGIVAGERVVREDVGARGRIGCETLLSGHFEQHPGRSPDVVVDVSFAVAGEDQHPFAVQVGRPVVGTVARTGGQHRGQRDQQRKNGFSHASNGLLG